MISKGEKRHIHNIYYIIYMMYYIFYVYIYEKITDTMLYEQIDISLQIEVLLDT